MEKGLPQKSGLSVIAIIATLSASFALLPPMPGRALPLYSRRYEVPCESCHTTAPRLNAFGMAFQANHFRWPGGSPPARSTGLKALPISGLAIASYYDSFTGHSTHTDFHTLELFTSDGFALGPGNRPGGWFVDYFAAVKGARAGDLGNAFVSVPIAGTRGQWALTAGQFQAMSYQYDALNSLTRSQPAALSNSLDGFSLTDAAPGLRLEFYDGRSQMSAGGNYLDVGVPFTGHLTLNRDSRFYGTTHGAYVHAFRRWGQDSLGVFGYTRSGNHLEGLLGTKELKPNLSLLGAAAIGRDVLGSADRLSLEADFLVNPSLAFTGRLDSARGEGTGRITYPVAGVTFYPFPLQVLRLSAETIQAPGNRSFTAYLFGQF